MSGFALANVQKALYGKLVADGVLMGMVTGVFDAVPQNSQVPYVVIGNGVQVVPPVEALPVAECRLDIHVWTDAVGRKTALAVLSRIHALLHLGMLAVEGFSVAVLRTEQASVRLSEDGTHIRGELTAVITVGEV